MSETAQAPHYLARDYLERRIPAPKPLPTQEEVRRELGWILITAGHACAEDRLNMYGRLRVHWHFTKQSRLVSF
jgi:hypothetical protein